MPQPTETRKAINEWRTQAAHKEKEKRVKMMAMHWLKGTKEARVMGPYTVPRTLPEAKVLFADLRRTPKGAVRHALTNPQIAIIVNRAT